MAKKSIKDSIKDAVSENSNGEKKNTRTDVSDQDKTKVKAGPGEYSRRLAAFWIHQIDEHDRLNASFHKRGTDIVKRYRDDRNRASQEGQRKMNVLWSTTKIMLPALYSRCPIPIVDRKFLDRDPIGRLSSQIAERAMRNEIQDNGLHKALKAAILDRLLPGRGQVWIRYNSEKGESTSIPTAMHTSMEDDLDEIEKDESDSDREDDTKTKELEETGEQVLIESAQVDYIDWKDFYMFPPTARTWAEVTAVGKKILISKKQAVANFGEKIGNDIKYDTRGMDDKLTHNDAGMLYDMNQQSITVFEIWNKEDRRVYWVSTGYQYLCQVKNDFLKLTKFFPCPEPICGTTTNDSIQPVPDYYEWQDQAMWIDELTQRIAMLTKACKIAGTYDASNNALKRLLDESVENQLIPVDSWALHKEKGGVEGGVSFLPLNDIQKNIQVLLDVRSKALEDLDLITGITDIMRGTTDSRETLGGMRLKNNNTGTRLSEQQEEVARFCRDVMVLTAEIMCKHFTDEALIDASGILYEDELDPKNVISKMLEQSAKVNSPQQPAQQAQPQLPQQQPVQQPASNVVPIQNKMKPDDVKRVLYQTAQRSIDNKVQAAIDLLRKDIPRRYRISIETDSTIYSDKAQERDDAISLVETFGKFMKMAGEVIKEDPDAGPLMGKMLQSTVRKMRLGRDLEYAIDEYAEKAAKKAEELAKNPPPDPEMMKIQGQLQVEQQKGQIQSKIAQQEAQADIQIKEAEAQRDMEADQAKAQLEKQKMGMELDNTKQEFAMNIAERNMDHQHKQAEHQNSMRHEMFSHAIGQAQHRQGMRESETKHKQVMTSAKEKPKKEAKK